MRQIVILGGPGDGLVVAQVVADLKKAGEAIKIIGFLNDGGDTEIGTFPVLGTTNQWHTLADDVEFHIALLSHHSYQRRIEYVESLDIPDTRLATLIHPYAQVADNAIIGAGSLIAPFATIQPSAVIGRRCSIRASAVVGHDVRIGDYSYVGPNATLCGHASMDFGAYAAPNSVLRDKTHMGRYATLAAGTVAFKNVPDYATMLGNPARRVK